MVGQERDIINHEFSDMEEIDTKKSVKHYYKDKTRKRKKLEKKEKNVDFSDEHKIITEETENYAPFSCVLSFGVVLHGLSSQKK